MRRSPLLAKPSSEGEAGRQEQRRRAVGAEVRASGRDQPGVRVKLYPYQVEGVAFLVSRGRALLADEMGLGKTAQAIAAMAWLRPSVDAQNRPTVDT